MKFGYRKRVGVNCPTVQIDTLSYEPLSHKIDRFLHGDISSLDNASKIDDDYDENEEKFGNSYEEVGYYDIDNLEADPLNDNLDKLDLAEICCDNEKAIDSMKKASKEIKSRQTSKKSENQPAEDQLVGNQSSENEV